MGTTGVIRTFLLVDIIAMSLLALIYLRQRRMSFGSYFGWGILALLIPVLGPFLVISNRPGQWDPEFSLASDFRRLVSWAQRLLPNAPPVKKLGTLDRARLRRQRKKR